MKQEIKIIAGFYRGRKITFPDLPDLRPTPARIKETLFNWLAPVIRHSRCLDAFAGSGALGFEALSRGAHEVVMVESNKNVAAYLANTQKTLHCEGLTIICLDVITYLQQLDMPFDIIFLDPPFSNPQYELLADLIQTKHLLKKNGLLYIESPNILTLDTKYWHCRKQKKAGDVHYALWEFKEIN